MDFPCSLHGTAQYTFVSKDIFSVLQNGGALNTSEIHFVSLGKADAMDHPWLVGFVSDAFLQRHAWVFSTTFDPGSEEGIPAADAVSNDMRIICALCLRAALEAARNGQEEGSDRLLQHLG